MKRSFWSQKSAQRLLLIIIFAFLLFSRYSFAVVLDNENRIDVVLKDGTNVTLFGLATNQGENQSNEYYYLPVNLRLSQRDDGTPEFLFLKFTTEARADQGGISGALMHFLMTWGLTPEQDKELSTLLDKEYGGAVLRGAVPLLPQDETGTFQVVSATMSDEGMTPSLVTSGNCPLFPGGKAAAAARLDQYGAQLLAATFEKNRSITDVSISLNFSYSTLSPAARGRIIFDWQKLESEYESIQAAYKRSSKKRGWWIFSSTTNKYTYNEVHSHYDFLIERQIVRMEFDELISDDRVATIREAFFQYFLNAFSESADSEEAPRPAEGDEKNKVPNIKYGKSYKYKQSFISRSFKKKVQTFDLNYRIAIKWPYQIVGNLASWYDGVRDNKRCVASINLNDPFFGHRDCLFIVDAEAYSMFEQKLVNYVTVDVRKHRDVGNDFSDQVTLDAKYIQENGLRAQVTYARGEDQNPDVYDYKYQWSLRGGINYPVNPKWTTGRWEGVTLAAPVRPRTIELEADLDDLRDKNITRVTAQILYKQFDKDHQTNIHVSPAKDEPLIEKQILIDKDTRGYAYRLIVNHKTEGKLVLPWETNIDDDYIYAVIPDELKYVESDLFKQAQNAGKDLVNESIEILSQKAKNALNEKFDQVFGGIEP